MRIVICNERFLFRFGVDRVLLMLGSYWKQAGHEIIMMGNKLDPKAVEKCSDRFIWVPEAPDYLHGNDYTLHYVEDNWDDWFCEENKPDVALVAGWPFYKCIQFLRERCGAAIFHDYGAVPMEGMNEPQRITQTELRRLRKENLKYANKVVAISSFLEESQSKVDLCDAGYVVPTSFVHLGIDHLDLHLWDQNELSISQNDIISDIKKLKSEGYKIIFQPGRWESGNYKNSAASVDVTKKLTENTIKHKIMILAHEDALEDVPSENRENYFCLGFIDDDTMRKAMELSDAGISPTLWEGFDLPLGEMQYLNKPMFVMNIGAHPEVVIDTYFLCDNIDDMSSKLVNLFKSGLPIPEEKFLARCAEFRELFTWENSAKLLFAELEQTIKSATVVFIDVTNVCHDTANSGVMRVTRKVSHYLQEKVNTVFVMWDDNIKQYVFPYDEEVELLCAYGGPDEERITYRSIDGQPRALLDNVIDKFKNQRKIHLFTEVVNSKIMQNSIYYFHSNNTAVAAVFYDAIPIYRPELCSDEVSKNHKQYMFELSNIDVVMPIADHNGLDLKQFWQENKIKTTWVSTAGLAAEMAGVERITDKITSVDDAVRILFVSTLEPRKNHIRFLKGLEILFDNHPEIRGRITVHLVGNRYAGNSEIPDFVEAFCDKHKNVQWLGVVDDETLRKEYTECTFTVYPSEIEGFGMPIMESLWFAKPCLCNKDGSIGELAEKGGCCLTDVLSENAIAKSLYTLITDKDYYKKLQHEATEREITTWDEYVDSICETLSNLQFDKTEYNANKFSVEILTKLREYFNDWHGRRIIMLSNYYPPKFVGGAEIIAHNHAKTLNKEQLARVVIFSLDMSANNIPGFIDLEEYEGIPVIRVSMTGANFNDDGINFFNKKINEAFEELCELIRPDIVHCHNIIGMSLGVVDIARNHGAKVCVTLHDNWGFCYKNTMLNNYGELCTNVLECAECKRKLSFEGMNIPIGVRKAYFRRTFEKIDAYISPSQFLADTYIRAGFDFHKMNVLWNGIDLEKFANLKRIPSGKVRITVVAYFGKHKGIDTLIKAIALLNRPDVELNLVGDGEQRENYKKIATECGVFHQLRFWGKLANQDIGDAYAETDIYCLPSIWPENQPVSITEAMACGLPVVASNLGGSKELVEDGVTGFIYEAGNVDSLAEKLKILIDDVKLRNTLGAAGKEKMKNNSFKHQVGKLSRIYDEITTETFSSKKIIAVKGMRLPNGIDLVTDKDVLLWDWINFDKESEDIAGVLLLDGNTLEKDEATFCKEKNIPVLVKNNNSDKYKEQGVLLNPYTDKNDILRKIAAI